MFDLFVPYLVGVIAGVSVDSTEPMPVDESVAVVAAPATVADRAPEDQTPTGQFTTAAEIKPILGMTQGNWVAVRDYAGQDLVYFTHLMSWRCGLWDIKYGINGAPPDTLLPMEPCHLDTNAPNAMIALEDFLPYITLPQNSVDSVTVAITYDDGTQQSETFERARILIP